MNKVTKRTTIYLQPEIHRALRMKAAESSATVSDIINEAIKLSLKEDAVDLQAIKDRVNEPAVSYEAVLKNLKKDGLL